MGTCFGDGNVFYKFKLVKMRRERIYKNAFFGPLKACYGHKGLCSRWGRSQGFRKYPELIFDQTRQWRVLTNWCWNGIVVRSNLSQISSVWLANHGNSSSLRTPRWELGGRYWRAWSIACRGPPQTLRDLARISDRPRGSGRNLPCSFSLHIWPCRSPSWWHPLPFHSFVFVFLLEDVFHEDCQEWWRTFKYQH